MSEARLDGSGDWSRPSDRVPVPPAEAIRLRLDRLHIGLVLVERDLRGLTAQLSTPGVTDEIPETNAQLMLAVRALEDAQHRLERAMRLLTP